MGVGQEIAYTVNEELGARNYVKIVLDTDVKLQGKFVYCDLENPSKSVEEDFFVEAGEKEFKQFLDAYRPNGIGLFEKRLQKILLKNVGEQDGKITLKSVSASNREVPVSESLVYLEKGDVKIGVDLAFGGSITYISRTQIDGKTIDEIIDKDGNVKIGIDAKSEQGAELISSEVNLTTIYDPGRQIQQSYYANVGGSMEVANGNNGYQRGYCFTGSSDGWWWPYNPVQAADAGDNPAQLIDYEIVNGKVWIKARPMDWGKGWKESWAGKYEQKAKELGITVDELGLVKGGVTTKSYVENVYEIKGNLIFVDNQFIDWNGFSDMDTIPVHTNEIPAFFPVHPLHTFVTYAGKSPWGGDPVGLQRIKNPPSTTSDGKGSVTGTEDWFAWVNDEDFGMGVYVPNTQYYAIGKSSPSAHKDAKLNKGAKTSPMVSNPNYLRNKPYPTSDYTSCYVFNACYTAPVVMWAMQEYKYMEYQYVVAIDKLENIRSSFYDIHENNLITNETLNAWR